MARELNDVTYSFQVEWYDEQACFARPYILSFYTFDNAVSMVDLKQNRMFLKRVRIPEVRLEDLFIGAMVTVHARQLKVVDYGNEFTRAALTNLKESTIAVITSNKIDKLGSIMCDIVNKGLVIGRIRSVKLSRDQAMQYNSATAAELSSGTAVAVEVIGNGASEVMSQMLAMDLQNRSVDADTKFFFQTPLASSAMLNDCSLCIVKPHLMREGCGHEIVEILQREGLKVSAVQRLSLDRQAALELLGIYFDVVPHANTMVDELQSGACLAIEVQGPGAYQKLRDLCGPPDPEIAKHLRPNTIRAQYGKDVVQNAVHCTDLSTDGPLECEFIFRSVAGSELIKATN